MLLVVRRERVIVAECVLNLHSICKRTVYGIQILFKRHPTALISLELSNVT